MEILLSIFSSIIYTLAVTLLPYVITFFITKKKHLTKKTTKILTIIFSIISFAVFCVIGFLSGQNGISVAPVVIWNIIGYLIIRTNIKQDAESTNKDTDISTIGNKENASNKQENINDETIALPSEIINTKKNNMIKVKAKKTVKHKEKLQKRKSSTIILSITTAIFVTSTIVLSVCLANATAKIDDANSKINDLEIIVKQKETIHNDLRRQIEYYKNTSNALRYQIENNESIYQPKDQIFNWDKIIENAN